MAKYFSDDEFRCKCCGALPPNNMNPVLVDHLDKLREKYGHRIMVSSAYRCLKHNAEVGGISTSQHTKGNACDIYVDGDYVSFYRLVVESGLFDGIGFYTEEFVHVDVRDNGESPNYYIW